MTNIDDTNKELRETKISLIEANEEAQRYQMEAFEAKQLIERYETALHKIADEIPTIARKALKPTEGE